MEIIPSFNISLGNVLNIINGTSLLSLLGSTLSPPYGIYAAATTTSVENTIDSLETNIANYFNKKYINFNSVISFELQGQSAITTAPLAAGVEMAGSYSSVNKVRKPNMIKMRIAVEGLTAFTGFFSRSILTNQLAEIPGVNDYIGKKDSRQQIINKLEEMKSTTNLYNIETPDTVYANYDLLNYNFVMSAKTGPTLLAIDLIFQEVLSLQTISLSDVGQVTSTTTQVNSSQAPSISEVL